MRYAILASMLTAGLMFVVFGGVPAESQAEQQTQCQYCGKGHSADCPHCAKGQSCPHCGKRGHHGHGWHHGHKWEYMCVHRAGKANATRATNATEQFNGLAEQGWKLAEADSGLWCFKRMKPDQ